MVYDIAILLVASVEIPCLSAEYGIHKFQRVIRNAMLDGSGQLPLKRRRKTSYPHGLNGSQCHITNSKSRNGVVCKTTKVCTNSSVMFAAVWTVRSVTITSTILDTISQKRMSPICPTMNLNPEMARLCFSNKSRFCL